MRTLVTPRLVDVDPPQHADEPTPRILQSLDLLEARIRAHADLLHEILGVRHGTREPVRDPVEDIVMPLQQRLETRRPRAATFDDFESSHIGYTDERGLRSHYFPRCAPEVSRALRLLAFPNYVKYMERRVKPFVFLSREDGSPDGGS